MGKLTPEMLEEARRAKRRQIAVRERASFLDVGGAGIRYLDRATRLAGLGIGTAVGASPFTAFAHFIPGVKDWIPDVERTPEAIRAFNKMRQQGDWDAAIGAYQDVLDAGPGFWGASEVAGSLIPTGGPALAGARLISTAPKLAGTIARVAPLAARPGAAAGIQRGLTGTGKVLRAPWELEEAAGRLALKGIGRVAGPVVRPITSRFRRPAVEAVEDTPSGMTPDEVAATDEFLRPEFPEPWDIRPVYEGPQPGVTNLERLAAQEVDKRMHFGGFLGEAPEGPWTAYGRPADPGLGGPVFAAQEARMAQPIATGKKALIDRVDFEIRMKRLDPKIGYLAIEWLNILPGKYLDDLGSSFVNKIRGVEAGPGMMVGGKYDPSIIIHGQRSPGIISIAKKVVNQSSDGDRTIIHEVAHHLEDFVSSRDARQLVSQFRREMRDKGERLIAEVEKIRSETFGQPYFDEAGKRVFAQPKRLLVQADVDKIRAVYRYEGGFEEWFAEVLTDKALRDLYMEIPRYRNIIQKVMAQIKVMAVATRDFIARVLGRGDEAERVYKKLIGGDYSAAERRSLRSHMWDVAEEAAPTPTAALFTTAAREVAEEAVTPPPGGGVLGGLGEAFEGLGQRFIAPLRGFADVMEEVKTIDNPIIRDVIAKSGISPSVARGTTAGRASTAYNRQVIAIDELADTAVSAALDFHSQKWFGRMGHILPIDRNGYFGQTGKLWNDVFSNPSNPAYNLTTEQRAYIDDFTRLIDDVEEMRVAAGLEPRDTKTAEGWFYVPRQVVAEGDIPRRRPSNPNLARIWDEATEAFETKGTRYLNDPRETALLHIRAAYKEVAGKQLSDVLEPISIRASEIVNPAIREAMESSLSARRAAEREVNRLRVPRVEKPVPWKSKDRPRGEPKYTRVTPEEKALRAKLRRQRRDAKVQLDRAKETYEINKHKYKKALNSARDAEIAPGKLFGPNQPDKIPVRQWRNRFFREEDYEALKAGLEVAWGPGGRANVPGGGWRAFQSLGNTIRFLASVGDFAMPLIHGLPLLARDPAGWGRMALRHHQAFFDPKVQARLIRDNLAEYQWLARNGVPIGDPEFFAALAPGQGFSLDKVASLLGEIGGREYADSARNILRVGGKQTFGRFQAAYNVGLGYSRVQILKALRGTWKGTDAELAQYIRNMTGGLDSRALGVGPNQRSVEGMFLAFSPRLLRSTVALVADAASVLTARPGATTEQGRQSLQSLAHLAGGVMGLYALSGWRLGKSKEEVLEGMNPLSGRRFLSHNINGSWVGVGGQIRALTQFMATMYSTLAPEQFPGGEAPLSGLWTADQYENPFLRFYSSRGAPGVSMIAGIIEAGPGDIDALPFDQIAGPLDLLEHLGTSALPFALQGHLEGGEFWRRPSLITGLEMGGLRGGVDLRDRKSQEIFGQEYRHVEPYMQRMIREIVPEDVSQFDRIEQERRQSLLELQAEVHAGQFKNSWEIYNQVLKINWIAKGAKGEAGQDIDFEPPDVGAEDLGIRALNQRYDLFDDPEVVSEETGRLKYIIVKGKRVSVLSVKLAELEATWTGEQKAFVIRNTNTQPIPIDLVASLPEAQRQDIARSQTAREKHLTDQGRYNLARLSRRILSLESAGE